MKKLLTITALLFNLNGFGQSFDDTLLRFDWGIPKPIVKWQLVKAVPTACPDAATTDKFGRISGSYNSCAVVHYELKREKLSKEFKSVYLALQFYKELVEESKKGHSLFHNGIDSIEAVPKYISTLSDTINTAGTGIKKDTIYKNTPLAAEVYYNTDGVFKGIRCHIYDTLTMLELEAYKIKTRKKPSYKQKAEKAAKEADSQFKLNYKQ